MSTERIGLGLLQSLLVLAWGLSLCHLLLPDDHFVLSVGHAMTGYWAPLSGLVLLGAVAFGRHYEALAAVPITVMWLAWTIPGTVTAADVPAQGHDLRLVTANVLMVHPHPSTLRDEILAQEPDVIVLQEVSQRWVDVFWLVL